MNNNMRDRLFNNCIYYSIAHAMFIADEPYFAYTASWDGNNFNYVLGATRGTISFGEDFACGAFRNETSRRIHKYPRNMKALDLFSSAPENIRKFAESETLMYLFDEIDGFLGPVATSGFWITEDQFHSDDEYEDFLAEGGYSASEFLGTLEDVKQLCIEEFDLSEEMMAVVEQIYSEYLKNNREISLEYLEKSISACLKDYEGYKDMCTSLSEINIKVV